MSFFDSVSPFQTNFQDKSNRTISLLVNSKGGSGHPRHPYKFFLLIEIKNKISNLGFNLGERRVSRLSSRIPSVAISFREKFRYSEKVFWPRIRRPILRRDEKKTRWRFLLRVSELTIRDNANSASSIRVYLRNYIAHIHHQTRGNSSSSPTPLSR